MRYIYILIALSINYFAIAQAPQFFNLGQAGIPNENECIVIKSNSKALKNIDSYMQDYALVKNLKLVGFNKHDNSVDSVLKHIKPMKALQNLTFENCDLSTLETSFAGFTMLEKVSVIKESNMFENTLFPLLKNNNIKTICIQSNDPEIITDSLYLLPHLKSLELSSNAVFNKANHAQTFQIKNKDVVQNIDMVYFGDFYKPNTSGVKSVKTSVFTQKNTNVHKLDCIRQPIPGIRINDTTYTFSPDQTKQFEYQSGTKLLIDPNAFLTENGQAYKGPVNLFYREFRNPVEIMLSGIPMTNKIDGETRLFKSGGMYEISASDQNNKPLTVVSDTSIKINFALTDTSKNFQFFSLNNNGSWTTTNNNIAITPAPVSKSNQATRAVREYFSFINNGNKHLADTARYNTRFYSNDYLYTYRKDNFYTDPKKGDTAFVKKFEYKKKPLRSKAMFRVKYYKQTKDKEIIFVIVSAKNHISLPPAMNELLNKEYLYTGNLSKEEFKRTFNKKLLCWDVRTTSNGDEIELNIKTDKDFKKLSGKIITLKEDKTYIVHKKGAVNLNQKMTRMIRKEARSFDNGDRLEPTDFNNLNYRQYHNSEFFAYTHSKKFQDKNEQKFDFEKWKLYVKIYASQYLNRSGLEATNELGLALLKSGLGFKNIDCYIHSGQMQDIYVNYNHVNYDTLRSDYNTILFKSINTNYALSGSQEQLLTGYYFKNQPNYIVRFSNNGTMQVTKPDKIAESKKGNTITLDYAKQFNVKGMDSNAITRLILD